jgi:hypothetical protein
LCRIFETSSTAPTTKNLLLYESLQNGVSNGTKERTTQNSEVSAVMEGRGSAEAENNG